MMSDALVFCICLPFNSFYQSSLKTSEDRPFLFNRLQLSPQNHQKVGVVIINGLAI